MGKALVLMMFLCGVSSSAFAYNVSWVVVGYKFEVKGPKKNPATANEEKCIDEQFAEFKKMIPWLTFSKEARALKLKTIVFQIHSVESGEKNPPPPSMVLNGSGVGTVHFSLRSSGCLPNSQSSLKKKIVEEAGRLRKAMLPEPAEQDDEFWKVPPSQDNHDRIN